MWAGNGTWAGETVTPDKAMTLSAMWRGIRLTAETPATLPLNVFQYGPDNRGILVRDAGNQYDLVLRLSPNANQTPVEFWEGFIGCMLLLGDGLAHKERNAGRLVGMTLMDPTNAKAERNNGVLTWRYRDPNGREVIYPDEDVFHLKGFGFGGDRGMSIIQYGAQSLSSSLAADKVAGKMFRSGLSSSGFLETAQVLNEPDRERLEKIMTEYQGSDNAGKLMILEGGMRYTGITMTAADAQLLLSRQFNIEEVGRWLGMPPILLGHAAPGQTMWGCLPAGTKVLTAHGPMNIEQVAIGDEVWTLDGKAMTKRRVTRSGQTGVKPLYTIEARGRCVRATANHEFLVRRKYASPKPGPGGYRVVEWRNDWVAAENLTTEDYLLAAHDVGGQQARMDHMVEADYVGRGKWGARPGIGFDVQGAVLSRVTKISQSDAAEPVFDIEVDGTHNFIADGVVVHNSGVEQIIQAWYSLSLRALLVRIEKAIQKRLIEPADRQRFFAKFNVEGLLRGDSAARAALYSVFAQNGIMTRDEIRELEDLAPYLLGGSDVLTAQVNLTTLDQIGALAGAGAAAGGAFDQQVKNLFREWLGVPDVTTEMLRTIETRVKMLQDQRTHPNPIILQIEDAGPSKPPGRVAA